MARICRQGHAIQINLERRYLEIGGVNVMIAVPDCANTESIGEPSVRPRMSVALNGKDIVAEADSGSQVTYGTNALVAALQLQITEHRAAEASFFKAINGSLAVILGQFEGTITWQGFRVRTVVYVLNDSSNEAKLVLGVDTIAELNRQGGELLMRTTANPPPASEQNFHALVPTPRRQDDTDLIFVRIDLETLGFTLLKEPGRVFKHVLALLDTGSSRTMVRYSILRTLDVAVVPKPKCVLLAANGSKIDILGEARINICCAQFKFEIVVLAVTEAHSPFPVVFGADLIKRICDTGHIIGVDANAGRVHIDGQYFSTQVYGLPPGQHRVNSAGDAVRVKIRINGRQIEALFDTGCTLTFCSETAARELKMRPSQTQPAEKTAVTATGDRMFFGKSAFVKINLQHREIYHRIYVTRDEHSPAPVVLGTDIMRVLAPDNTISLDFGRRKVTFATEALDFVNLVLDEHLSRRSHAIRLELLQDTVVRARTDMVVPVCFREQPKAGATYLVTEKPHRYTVKVGGSLHEVRVDQWTDGRFHIWIRVLNLGGNDVLLKAKSVVAQAEEVASDHVTEPVFQVNSVTTPEEHQALKHHLSQKGHHDSKRACRRPPKRPLSENEYRQWDERLKRELGLTTSILSPSGKVQLQRMLRTHPDAFVQSDNRLGRYSGPIRCQIDLVEGARPFQLRPHRVPLAMEDEIRKQLETLLQQQVIRPSNSPFASPIVMVKKADGKSFRMAIDYRRLNSLTCPATYVIPLMSDLTDKVAGHKLYSTFDFQSAFHMIPMAEEDIEKTAFITPYGLFEYLTMPFGIKAGPVVMTRVMESLRQELTAAFFVYIDDVCLASDSESQHLKDIEQFLTVLEKYGLRLRLDKCHYGQSEVRYLGVLVSERGIRPDPAKISAVRSTKVPKTLTELRSFIGAVSYWRKFIPRFASIMHPLYQLTKNDGKIVGQDGKVIGVVGRWSAECQDAFELVIQKLITAPVLAAPWIGHPFIVETDASKTALGACLMQENRDKEIHPICYASKLTNKHQERFPSVELEALALVWALQLFQPYLIGSGVTTVRSDNNAMCSLMKKRDATLTGRLARYQLAIQHFDVNIVHRSGSSNKFCDFLSRYPGKQALPSEPEGGTADESTMAIEEVDLRLTAARIRHEQAHDEELQDIYKAVVHNKWPKDSAAKRKLEEKAKKYGHNANMLHYKARDDPRSRIALPPSLRERAIRQMHEDEFEGAHLGPNKCIEKISRVYYWKGMAEDVRATIASCRKCQSRKSPPAKRTTEPLHYWPAPELPQNRLHVDVGGPYVKSADQSMFVLVSICALTKWATVSLLRRQTADIVADVFEKDVICQRGVPRCVVTDQGSNFLSSTFAKLAELFSFQHITVSAHHQSANGQAERFMSTLATMISAYVNAQGTNWHRSVHKLVFAYNTAVHATTNQSPFYTTFGRHALTSTDLRLKLFEDEEAQVVEGETEAEALRRRCGARAETLQAAWKTARQAIENKEILRNEYADERRRAKPHEFKEQQLVLRYLFQPPKEEDHKFRPRWQGPFLVTAVNGPNVTIKPLADGRQKEVTVHADQLKPFVESITLPIYARTASTEEAVDEPPLQSEVEE